MFSTRLNPFIHIDPADHAPAGKPPSPSLPSSPAYGRPHLPRADSYSGNRFQHHLLQQLSRMTSRKPITWQQMCQKNNFFQPLRQQYSYTPSQLLKSMFSSLRSYFPAPAMQPHAQSHPGRPLYPMPQAFSSQVMPGSYPSPQVPQSSGYSPSQYQPPAPPKFNTVSGLAPASKDEKSRIQALYSRHLRECEQLEGHDAQSAIAMTARELKQTMPEYANYQLADLKKFVRESLDMPTLRPGFSSQTPDMPPPQAANYSAPKIRIPKLPDGGSSAYLSPFSGPRFQASASVPQARPPASPPVSPSSTPKVQVPASGQTSGLSASAFLAKWQNTPFKSNAAELEIPIEYSTSSALGQIPKEGNAGQFDRFTERVSVVIPGNLKFSSERHYALYANAMLMSHLHERKAEGYTFGINDFHWHTVSPSPQHARQAAQAKQLAENILRADDKDLDRLEAQVATMGELNKGLGLLKPESVSKQISRSAWEAKCEQDAKARQDLLQMGESGVKSHAVLKNVYASVHHKSVKQGEFEQRKKDKHLVQQDITRNIETWVKGALSRNPNNIQAAKNEVHKKIRNSCDLHLSDHSWKNREILRGKTIDKIIDTNNDKIARMMLRPK